METDKKSPTREEVKAFLEAHLSEETGQNLSFSESDKISKISDAGIDSLDFVELLMVLEAQFSVELEDGDTDKLQTIGELLDAVCGKKGA